MTLQEYKDLVDLTITNKTANYSITPSNVGQRMKDLADNVDNFATASLAVPLGTIIMYAPATTAEFDSTGLGIGANVLGWAICNLQNGTPDLRGKFVVGYNPDDVDYNTIGETGGQKLVTQVLEHSHLLYADLISGASPVTNSNYVAKTRSVSAEPLNYEMAGTTTTPTLGKSSTTGSNSPDNRPPFYTVLYIKKIV